MGEGDHHHHAHAHDVNRHDARITALCLTSERPVDAAALDLFLQALRAMEAATILRLKGIIALAERPSEPLVLHGVQHVMHQPVRLQAWPDADRRSRLVVIAQDLPAAKVTALWAALTGQAVAAAL